MPTAKKLLLGFIVATVTFASFQSFITPTGILKCAGSEGYCRIILPDGTMVEWTGGRMKEVFPEKQATAHDENIVVSNL